MTGGGSFVAAAPVTRYPVVLFYVYLRVTVT